MRGLIVILWLFAMLVPLSGPVAASAVAAPCDDASMAEMVMADMESCTAKDCVAPCLATGICQNQCGSAVPLLRIDPDYLVSPILAVKLHVTESEPPSGTGSPVDGPPPRI